MYFISLPTLEQRTLCTIAITSQSAETGHFPLHLCLSCQIYGCSPTCISVCRSISVHKVTLKKGNQCSGTVHLSFSLFSVSSLLQYLFPNLSHVEAIVRGWLADESSVAHLIYGCPYLGWQEVHLCHSYTAETG